MNRFPQNRSGRLCHPRSLVLISMAIFLVGGQPGLMAQQGKTPGVKGSEGADAGNPPAQTSATTSPSGNAENGKRVFTKDGCFECHDREGQGGAGTGPRLAQNPITFSAFIQQLRHPASQMPPYTAKVLSDEEAADIYAYLHSIPKPPAAPSIPLLQDK